MCKVLFLKQPQRISKFFFFKYDNYLETNKTILEEMLDLCYRKSWDACLSFYGFGGKKTR